MEDQVEFRELWTEILSHTEGYSCVGAYSNAQDAIEGIGSVCPDVVLMDIHLSNEMDGIECVFRLREVCKETEFMMFTVFQDEKHVFEALKVGATGYILKKTRPERVLEAIEELYGGGSPMSAAIARYVLRDYREKHAFGDWGIEPLEDAILVLLAKGLPYKEIDGLVGISFGMVKQTIHTIYKKLAVANRTEAVNKYFGI